MLSFETSFFAVNLLLNAKLICNPPLHPYIFRNCLFLKVPDNDSYWVLKKRRSNVFFNALTIFSHSQMFPFIAQHKEVKRSRKTAARERKKKQRSRETCQAAILLLTLELPTCCAESVELRLSFQVTRKWSHGASAWSMYIPKKKQKQNTNTKQRNGRSKNKFDIQLFLGSYWVKMLQEAQWREMDGNQDVRILFLFYSLGFFCWAHSIQEVVYEVFYRWMHSLPKMQTA